ncbi:conserved hypothetical protein [Leishmania braziliensis MHOM/BR/75/M2904]|uniref:B box-type domain-containing protein n=2 Tax=Leishmania braziliensis TaxID=5660 RepID=A4HKY0_LEIBR|nr:conserved hypothetical protein [Leishmania braziliensis MHOM/BR/75/M2904]CAJ2478908.1 unnamed protein product [Leishmania braziliensis]CAM43159.2 conserved hypothetical protein [Leishmania braziliensis MHOM/BR/75/M2904]SYZ68869.1 B-box_zinc_finger_containing_protein [Leishmania braziliensis MHOM/BR/75/M2904]
MAASSCASSPHMYLRIVVYCDDSQTPHTLPDVRVPRRVNEVWRFVESQVGQRAKVLSYWNYTHNRYELLRDVRDLLQADGRLLSRRPRTAPNGAATVTHADETTAPGNGDASVGGLDREDATLCIYCCQLWMETVLIQLEPVDKRRDREEYDELRSHVARWLGNKHVGFEVKEVVRIRCPFLTRMFDETRSTRLSSNREKVQLLYYSNNAWSVRDVLQYGFLLSNGLPKSLEAVPRGAETGLSTPAPPVPGAASASSSSLSPAPTPTNTLLTPFVFTSSMLSTRVKYMPANRVPHKVLLCEVAPGRRFMTDQGLTGENPDKQAFPIPAVKPPPGYDSVCYIRAKKQKTSLRTEEASEIAAEDLSLVQVQVQHSYQALPRYLLTVVPSAVTPSVQQHRESGWCATASPVRTPGTTAQAAAAREDGRRMSPAGQVRSRPSSPSPPSKHYNMKEWFKSSPRRRTVSMGSGMLTGWETSAATSSPQSARGMLREVRYADNSVPRQRAASDTIPGRASEAMRSCSDTSEQRRIARKGGVEDDIDNAVHHGSGGLIGSIELDSVGRRSTGTAGYGGRARRLPWTSGSCSADSGGFCSVSPKYDASYGSVRAASAPRAPPTQGPSLLNPCAAQLSPSTNSAWATGGVAPSPSFNTAYYVPSCRDGLLYKGLPHGRSAKSRDATQPLIPAARGHGADRRAGSVGTPLPAALYGAPSRPPLLPQHEGAYAGSAMNGRDVVDLRQETVPSAAQSALPSSASSTAPFSQPQAPPAAFNQFICETHPHQLQLLYCTACEELTCPYCASVGAHRTHVVVEAREKAAAVRAEAEALQEKLRYWLVQYRKTEEGLRAEQARYAARQRRDLRFVQRRFLTLKQALHQAECSITQTVQEAQCRPPLAEAAAMVAKYSQALAPIDAALRRYHSLVVASGGGSLTERTRGSMSSVPELLHFLCTTPPLIHQVQDSFAQHKDEERRLHDAIVDYETRSQANEAFFQHFDWTSLRQLLVNLGSVRTNMVDMAEPQKSASVGSFYSSWAAPPQLDEATSLCVPGKTHSQLSTVTGQARSQTSMVLSSPVRDASSDVSRRLLDNLPLDTYVQSDHSAASSPSLLLCSKSPPTRQTRFLQRCLTDFRRGYIWVIHSATSYFAPGQRKTVCSTPFRLLGVSWELRIAPLPRARRHGGNAPSTLVAAPEICENMMTTAISRPTSPNLLEGGDSEFSGGQACSSPLVSHSMQGDHYTFTADGVSSTLVAVVPPPDEEEEWLGLFLFPLQHRLRLNFRVIVFSEVAWTEWQVTGWVAQFAGRGWGLYPFLHRRELMRTDKLARDNTVKICIAPTSDLY